MSSKRIITSLNRITLEWPCLTAAVVALFVFSLLKAFYHFPLIADDFGYAGFRAIGRLEITDFNFLNRRPVSTILTFLLFQSRLPEVSEIQFPVIFFLHALSLAIIADYFRPLGRYWIWASVFALYPSLHEVLFMNLTLAWALGALFWAASIRARRLAWQVLFVTLAVCSLETYVLPILALPFVALVFDSKRAPEAKRRTLVWFVSMATYIAIKFFLDRINPPTGYALDLTKVPEQIVNNFAFIWSIHFYKTYWFATVVQALAFIAIFVKQKNRSRLFAAIAAIFLTTAPAWLLAYYAPRSVHASVILNLAFFTALAVTLAQKVTWRYQASVFFLLLISYSSQLLRVAQFKDHNYAQLKINEQKLTKILLDCPSLCPVDVAVVNGGFKSDWVMPEIIYNAYVEWVARRHGLQKTILVTEEIEP